MNSIDDIHRFIDAQNTGVVSVKPDVVKPVKKSHRSRFLVYVSGFAVSLVLGMSVLYPIYSKMSEVSMMSADTQNLVVVGENTSFNPYYYVPSHGMGTMGRWLLNSTVVKQWLRSNFYWRLQASVNGNSWSDANGLMDVGLVWNESGQSYKVTLTLNTTNAPRSLYYRFVLACNASLKDYVNDTNNATWLMTIPTDSGRDLTVFFNWSDIKQLVLDGKVTFRHGRITRDGRDYFFFRIQTVNRIPVGVVFVVDPVYGTIGNAVTDNWEWDAEEGNVYSPHATIRLGTSQYYATTAVGDTGTDYDGFLRVIKVFDNNGSISKTLIDKWEYDTSDGTYASIHHIGGNVYAVLYWDIGATIGKIFTTTIWSSNGTLKKDIIDTLNLAAQYYLRASFLHVVDNVYAIAYNDYAGTYDGYLVTVNITSAGIIDNSFADTIIFDTSPTTYSGNPDSIMLDSDTIAITWYTDSGYDAWLITYNISSTGNIASSYADIWEWDTGGTSSADMYYPCIYHISGNVYAMSYSDTSQDGWTKTFSINTAGDITASFIDTLEWADVNTVSYLYMFTINDASSIPGGVGVYGITFQDSSSDGWIYTINITSAGAIDASVNDKLEFDAADNAHYANAIYIANNYYLVNYHGVDHDGWACTFTIETAPTTQPWSNTCPTAGGEHPTNSTTGITLQPSVGGTVNDADTNHTLNVTFATNRSGSWVNKQTNSSVARGGKVNWTYSMANTGNTRYWWRMYVHDGFCNQSFTYSFTTVANATPASWHIVNNTINGGGYNITSFKIISSTVDGSAFNISSFKILDNTKDGSGYNSTSYKILDNTKDGSAYNRSATWVICNNTINGLGYNASASYKIINNTIDGSCFNLSSYHIIDNTKDGQAYNSTSFKIISNTVDGQAFNGSAVWRIISSDINGSAYNFSSESWKVVNDTISGSAYNRSSSWFILNDTISGSCFNSSAVFKIINNTIDGSAFNISSYHICQTLSGSAYNSSLYHIINSTISGSAYNTSGSWFIINNTINGSCYNISIDYILIANEHPINTTLINHIIPSIYFTISQTNGNKMNYTIYWNTSTNTDKYFTSSNNLSNGTYYYSFSNASNYGMRYYWRVQANDGTHSVNETYYFKTGHGAPFITQPSSTLPWLIGLFGIIGFILFILFYRNKKKRYDY